MPSIRRSLLVYFLLLLALALGGMALLADSVTGRALAEKEEAEGQRIDLQADEKEQEKRDEFDRDLLAHARDAASIATSEYIVHVERVNGRASSGYQAAVVGGMSTAILPGGSLDQFVVAQLLQPPAPVGNQPWRTRSGPLAALLTQDGRFGTYLPTRLEDDDPATPLVQINTPGRLVWKSARLPADGLPFDPREWEQGKKNKYGDEWQYDTLDLPGGGVRRVVYKPNTGGFRGWGQPATTPRPDPPRPTAPSALRDPTPGWVNYYHVARPTADLDVTVAIIRQDAGAKKADLAAASHRTRDNTRLLLAGGSIIAFALLLLGGWVVVGVGLLPLRKLTAAVAKVSEKDLHLPVTASELSLELVPIHDRLEKALSELREAFDREKQAVADISHELRTPVAGLLATIDVTLRKPRTADQYKQALDDCRGIAKQLGGLVERVMTLAYLDAGQTPTASTPTDPAELARGCAAVIRPLAESQGLTLTTDVQATPLLSTDPDKLREVMINLLHNAVEYNRPGGSVNLAVRGEPNGKTVVEVSDTGIGMTADVRGKIFERFFRADPSRTATGVHAGLGLAIVKEYVSRLGGTISVESESGQGSTFRVTLPA